VLKKLAITSIGLATMLIGPAQQALAQHLECQNLYLTHMYSDASHTVEVGFISGICAYPYPLYTLHGTYTYYQEDELAGTCGCGPIE
jgi:hypothetical protein